MKFIAIMKILIIFQITIALDLTVDLYKYDIFSILSDDVLSYDSIEDNLNYEHSRNLDINKDSSISPIQSYEGNSFYSLDIKNVKIHDIVDYEKYFTMLIDYTQQGEVFKNQIYVCQLNSMDNQKEDVYNNKVKIDCQMQDFTSADYKCGQMQMDKEYIYVPCISYEDSTFQLCKKNYINDTISQCILFQTEFQLKPEEIQDEELGLTRYENKNGNVIFLLYFKNSKINYYHSRFFLIRDEKFEVLEIPIRNFIIGKMEVYSYQKNYDKILIFVTNFSGFQQDLLMMKVNNGYINKDFLKNSVIKTNIRSFDYSNNSLIIFDEDRASSVLTMTQLSIETFRDQKIQIQSINYLKRNSYKNGISVLEVLDNTNQKKFYMYNSHTQRYFEIKQVILNNDKKDINAVKKFQDYHWWFVVSYSNKHFFIVLDQRTFFFDIYIIQDVKYIQIQNSKYKQFNKNQGVSFYDKDQVTYNLTVNFSDFDAEKFDIQNEYLSVPDKLQKQRLRIYGNNLELDPEISYFNHLQIEIDYGTQEEEIKKNCRITFETMTIKYYFIFCDNGQLVVFYNIELSRSKLKLSNHKLYQTNYYYSIKQAKIHHNEIIILITERNGYSYIYYAYLDITKRLQTIIEFTKERDTFVYKNNCYFLSHGICCQIVSTKKRVVYDYVVDQDVFKLKQYFSEKLDEENQVEDFYSFNNSFINKQIFSYIRKDSFFQNYWFIVKYNDHFLERILDLQIQQKKNSFFTNRQILNNFSLSKEARYYYISTNNHVIITQYQPKLYFYGLCEGSFINYPYYFKNYQKFYQLFNDPRENLFLITYYTTEGHFRGSLYKTNVKHLYNRLIKDFLIEDQECLQPQIHTKLLKFQFIIFSVCSNDRNKKKVWKYNLQGPIVNVDGHSSSQYTNINGKQYKLNFKYKKLHQIAQVKTHRIKIIKVPKKNIVIDLEQNENLILNGDFREIVQLDQLDKAKIVGRDTSIESIQLLYDQRGFRVLPEIYMTFDQQKPLLLFANYIYSNKKLDINYRYKNCKYISPSYFDNKFLQFFQKLFICQEKATLIYKITDFIDIHVELPNENQTSNKFYNPILLQIKSRLYIFGQIQTSGKTLFMIRTFFQTENNQVQIQIEKIAIINADTYTHQFSPIHQYYCFYNSVLDSIIILLQPYNSQIYYLLRMNLVDHQIDKKDTQQIWFTETTRINIYSSNFQQIDDDLHLIGSSEYQIYEFRIWYSDKWEYELIESFLNPMGNLKGNEILKKNENYLIMLYEKFDSKNNILVWKRKQRKKSLPIFTTISQRDFKLNYYRIDNIDIIYDSTDNKDYIYVAFFQSFNRENNRFHSFYLNKIQIGNIKLEIDSSLFKFQEIITLRIFQFDNTFAQFEIPIVFKEKTKLFQFQLMCYFLIFLVVLLVGILANCIYTNFQIQNNLKIWQAKQKIKRDNEEFESQMINSNFE